MQSMLRQTTPLSTVFHDGYRHSCITQVLNRIEIRYYEQQIRIINETLEPEISMEL